MDLLSHVSPAVASVTLIRALLALIYGAAFAGAWLQREFFVRHYTAIVSSFSMLGMLGAAWLPLAVHGHRSIADMLWSVNSSLTTGTIVIYGFSRLPAFRTAIVVLTGCLIGVCTVFLAPAFDAYSFGRLCLHVAIVNICAFSLRNTIEQRERELFLLARDNLSKNVYAQELEAARARAEEGNEVKLRFLANMSHEFRTPMHGMLQTLEIVSRDAGREALALVDKARASGESLLATLDGILEYTGLTEPGLAPARSAVSLTDSVRHAVERHRASAESKGLGLSLRLDLARAEDIVTIDAKMWSEVISRLLDNAVRFTERGAIRVNVELKRTARAAYPAVDVELTIADTGVGIPARLHEVVFAPFFQVDAASTRQVGGAGLGLAIVRRLVDVMGGPIALDSTVDRGTTVLLRLPVEIRRDRASAARAARLAGTTPPATAA